ncbi:MAG: hypothetical protein P1P65_09185 [Treponema sp.]
MKKTVENETGNIRIEQIAKMEADTIGQVLIKDTDFVPLKKDESATTYQNLISGNDRKTNREGYVQFERRVRDIVEKCVRLMIPGGQSLFAAGQNDSNIKKFFQDSRKGFSYCTNSNGAVSDGETTATDWIHLLSSHEYAELPESLSEKYFTKQVFFSFASLLLLRLEQHRPEEGRAELLKLAEEFCPLIRLPWRHLTDYCNKVNALLDNPSDLTKARNEFQNDYFTDYDEWTRLIYWLTDFYKIICTKIIRYEEAKGKKAAERKWQTVLLRCQYSKDYFDNDIYPHRVRNDAFGDAIEIFRAPQCMRILEDAFAPCSNSVFDSFKREGSAGMFYQLRVTDPAAATDFMLHFIKGLAAILISELHSDITDTAFVREPQELDTVIHKIAEATSYDTVSTLPESQKRLGQALHSVMTEMSTKIKDYDTEAAAGTTAWFTFLKTLIADEALTIPEALKSKGTILHQNALNKKYSSAYCDFISQLQGIYEYGGFTGSLEILLKQLELYGDNTNQIPYFNKNAHTALTEKLKDVQQNLNTKYCIKPDETYTSPSSRHWVWCGILDSLYKDEMLKLKDLPKDTSEYKWSGNSGYAPPANKWDCNRLLDRTRTHFSGNTFITVIKDILGFEEDVYHAQHILDTYKYEGLVAQNPFMHTTAAEFYIFIYGFFSLLRNNISTLIPFTLTQSQIIEYTLMSYIAAETVNPENMNSSGKAVLEKEDRRKWVRIKLFTRKYFKYHDDDGSYKPSMAHAHNTLKQAVKKNGKKIGSALEKLAQLTDTKKKGSRLKDYPSSSAYVLKEILCAEPEKYFLDIPSSAVQEYRQHYFNYYLLCNVIKALKPFLGDRIDTLVSDIVAGINTYDYYKAEVWKRTHVPRTGFEYLLHQHFEKVSIYSKTAVCMWRRPFIAYPDYFWYSEQKNAATVAALRKYEFLQENIWQIEKRSKSFVEHLYHQHYQDYKNKPHNTAIDMELEQCYAEQIKQELGGNCGLFHFYWFRGRLEYYKYVCSASTMSEVIKYYQRAFDEGIYYAGQYTVYFVEDVFHLYGLGYYQKQKPVQQIKILKTIWQWSEAANVVDKTYTSIRPDNNINSVHWHHQYIHHYDQTRRNENIEKIVCELEKED